MKKNKILATILALVMLMALALPMPASAASMGHDGTITIKPPASGILAIIASSFTAYRLFDITNVAGASPNYEVAYEAVPAVGAFLAQAPQLGKYGAAAGVAATAGQFLEWLQDTRTEAEIIELARALATASPNPFAPITGAAQHNTTDVRFSALDYGYYLVVGQGAVVDSLGAHQDPVLSRAMLGNVFNNAGNKDCEINLKADAPKINKEVWNHNYGATPKDTAGWKKWTDVNIGDIVYFKHVSKVPDMTGYATYTFKVYDIMCPGLSFNSVSGFSVNLKNGGTTVPVKSNLQSPGPNETYYTLLPPDTAYNDAGGYGAGCTRLVIEFTDFIQLMDRNADNTPTANDKTGWTIEIIYEAVLNEKAGIGTDGNPNKVQLEYSNKPYVTTSTTKTPWDEDTIYTFDIEIFKYTGDLEDEYTELPGAEFELSHRIGTVASGEHAGDPIYGAAINFVKLTADPDGYDYRVAKPGDTLGPNPTKLVSQADGKIRVKGLDAGEYGLKETKAPAGGYNLLAGWTTAIIIHEEELSGSHIGNYSLTANGDVNQNSVNVLNNAGGLLPGTGGKGIYIFFGVGGLMAVLLAAGYALYQKKKRQDAMGA